MHKIKKTRKMPVTNELKSDKPTFKTKSEILNDNKRTVDKNNNWEVLGKSYNKFVFVSVRKLLITFHL